MSDQKNNITALEAKIVQAELKLAAPEIGGRPEEVTFLRTTIQQLREEKLLTMRASGQQVPSLNIS